MRLFSLRGALGATVFGAAALLFTGNALSQDSSSAHAPAPIANIVDTAVAAGSFNILVAALQATDLESVLADESRQFTVFAPTDAAFAKLGQETIDALLADPETLSNILLYHVVPDTTIRARDARNLAGSSITAANGDEIGIQVKNRRLFINDSKILTANVRTSNGIIHVINNVLMPPSEMLKATLNIVETAVAAGSFNTLASLLVATGLDSVLADPSSSFTVFAPTDDAFAALDPATLASLQADPELLKSVLLYHVIPGEPVNAATAIGLAGSRVETANGEKVKISLRGKNLFINMSKVITTDVHATNGIIHAINAVLVPPSLTAPSGPTLADIVKDDRNFSILNIALRVTGLNRVLDDSNGTFTVFAPTNKAFYQLGRHNLVYLFSNRDALRTVLLYHVVPDVRLDAATALTLDSAAVTTANGQDINIRVQGETLFINRSRVTATDIEATNGIAHVIDRVLIPRLH